VVAAGDSYNDLGMLKTADYCMLFSPPEQLVQEYPDIKVGRDYSSLMSFIESPNS
jgi:phosphoserine/homoserine phosphotransferase